MTLNYAGQAGQPTWLWGTNDGSNAYVWNPSNFSVNYANSAGYASSAGSVPATGCVYNSGTYEQYIGQSSVAGVYPGLIIPSYDVPTDYWQTGLRTASNYFCCQWGSDYYVRSHSARTY